MVRIELTSEELEHLHMVLGYIKEHERASFEEYVSEQLGCDFNITDVDMMETAMLDLDIQHVYKSAEMVGYGIPEITTPGVTL